MPYRLLCLVLVVGCSEPTTQPAVDAAPAVDASHDAPAASGDCANLGELSLRGAFSIDGRSTGVVTVSDKIAGFFGWSPENLRYALSVRRPLMHHLDSVGTIDVATVNLKYLEGTGCDTAGACTGFFALGGTFTVVETAPEYRATFMLTDLYRHDDTTDQLGAPIAGSVTGCVHTGRI